MNDYKILPVIPLQKGASFLTPKQHVPKWVEMDTPALEVKVTAFTVSPMETI